MKNITLSIDDEAYRSARVWAALHNTSVSAVVRDLLEKLRAVRPTRRVSPASVALAAGQKKTCQTCPRFNLSGMSPARTPLPPFPCDTVTFPLTHRK